MNGGGDGSSCSAYVFLVVFFIVFLYHDYFLFWSFVCSLAGIKKKQFEFSNCSINLLSKYSLVLSGTINNFLLSFKSKIETAFNPLRTKDKLSLIHGNLILDSEFNLAADINLDSIVNVLDVIQLVNIILN